MILHIQDGSLLPIYEQVVQQVKEQIAKGILQEGERIPSVRELSAALLINPNTVSKAYQELERQGVLITKRGKGTFIAQTARAPGMEKERMDQLRMELKRLIVEARHLGLSRSQFQDWVEEISLDYWGNKHA